MTRFAVFAAAMLVLALGRPGLADDQTGVSSADPATTPRSANTRVIPRPKSDVRFADRTSSDRRTATDKPSVDEAAIRGTGKTYSAAFSEGDAKAAAAHFTSDAEYVDAEGNVYQGRQAIEDLLTKFFAASPGCRLELAIDSLRFVGSDLAIEDGITTVMFADDPQPLTFAYTAVHVKNTGQWLTASVRERHVKNSRQHQAQLRQLDWLVGDWVHEGDDALVHFTCRSADGGNFLVRTFTVQIAGQERMTGSQRIGWDARAGKFRTWVFDSEGGYAEGYWHRDGDKWVLKLAGVTPDGEAASNTSVYSLVDANTMTFQSVHHEVAGTELPDSAPVTIVRQSPQPE